jgi:hypothetical protein
MSAESLGGDKVVVDEKGNVGIGTREPIGGIGLHLKRPRWKYTSATGIVIQPATANDNPGLMLFNSADKEAAAFGYANSGPGKWSKDAQQGDVTLRAAKGKLIFSTENVEGPPYPPTNLYPARMVID